jgi:predicted sulfurtransferase
VRQKLSYTHMDGVLLYYKYCEIVDTAEVVAWLEQGCARLRGRVRVAPDGVNATLRGSKSALQVRQPLPRASDVHSLQPAPPHAVPRNAYDADGTTDDGLS